MAFSTKIYLLLFLSFLFIHSSKGEFKCEELPKDLCAFSIASSGKRCSLETAIGEDGIGLEYQCRTSEVVVEKMAHYIESDRCVTACGVARNSVGISSDSLFDDIHFTSKLCSPACYHNCHNIVDLYFNLAAGEGMTLSSICEKQSNDPHRLTVELMSIGLAPSPAPL